MKAKVLIIVFFLFCVSYISAKETSDEVTLVVSAEGTTKEDATKIALRNAIEQAFGTFVSANTEILNDELVKEDIVTISNGNIKNFTEVNSAKLLNGNYTVTLSATVSVSKLVNYVKSKGGSIELAGATFAANVKMAKLNKANEEKAIDNLIKQIKELSVEAYDYSVELSEPKLGTEWNKGITREVAKIEGKVKIMPNSASKQIYDIIITTLISLSLSESDIEAYKKMNMPIFNLQIGDYEHISKIKNIDKRWEVAKKKMGFKYALVFALRSQTSIEKLKKLITNDMYKYIMSFAIIDNITSTSIPLDKNQCGYITRYHLNLGPSFCYRNWSQDNSHISLPDLTTNSPYIVEISLNIPIEIFEIITEIDVKKINPNKIDFKGKNSKYFRDFKEKELDSL